MFENDRFSPGTDFYSTYRDLGGRVSSPQQVQTRVRQLYEYLLDASRDAERFEAFPSVAEALESIVPGGLDPRETDLLDDLVAIHELGEISDRHLRTIRRLSRTHRLGVVSNVWARSGRFLGNLRASGLDDCFEILVWSSDHGCIKPAPKLFEVALNHFRVEPTRILFVGDHIRRDVEAAGKLGMAAAWVRAPGATSPAGKVRPDVIVEDLSELLDLAPPPSAIASSV